MSDNDRQTVQRLDADRKLARAKLTSDVSDAKVDLHPKTLAQRWANRQVAKIGTAAKTGAQITRKNAIPISLASAAILLFTARKPISRLYEKLRNRAPESEE
jgi:hypothetical protein